MAVIFSLLLAIATPLCKAQGLWPIETFMTEPWGLPRLVTETYGETAPGLLFIGPLFVERRAEAPMIVQTDGQLVWRSGRSIPAYNVDHQELNGQPVLTWWEGQHDAKGYGCGYGGVRILDETYTQIHHICGAHLDINPVDGLHQACKLDTHESRITPRGTLLATARSVIPADLSVVGGPKDGWVLDSIFYELEIPSEKVLMRWSTYEHRFQFPALQISHYPINTTHDPPFGRSAAWPWDFAHMNAVAAVPAPINGYIVSCRYLWSAIKVAANGDVEWYLEGQTGGDFTMPTTANFSFQHDVVAAEVTSKSMQLHMFDNANNVLTVPRRPSSGLLLSLDLEKKTVETLHRLSPLNVTTSTRTGSYQPLFWNDHVLVDFGHPPILNEFDGNGNVVWRASVADLQAGTYRAYKKAWVGRPTTVPKAAGQHAGEDGTYRTKVWASWNGATEVDRWEFYARRGTNESMHFVQEVPKIGFETLAELLGRYTQIKVNALFSNGTVMAESITADVQKSSSILSSIPSRSSWLVLAASIMVAALC